MKKETKKEYIHLANWYADEAEGKDPPCSNLTPNQLDLGDIFWFSIITPPEDDLTLLSYNETCRNVASALYSEAQTL
jgi:hypothetical protein